MLSGIIPTNNYQLVTDLNKTYNTTEYIPIIYVPI